MVTDGGQGPSLFVPKWNHLQDLLRAATRSVLLCSPYVSTEGIHKVFDFLPAGQPMELRVVTRLSPSDWANGISDPMSLAALLELYADASWAVDLTILQRLHAKVYLVDGQRCVLGSANLSGGGFDSNFELAIADDGQIALAAEKLITDEIAERGRGIRLDELRSWLQESESAVKAAADPAQESDALADVQRSLDRLLGRGGGHVEPGTEQFELEDFVAMLRDYADVPGAQVVIDRHTNARGDNLTGHVKQSVSAAHLFLNNRPDLLDACAASLDGIAREAVPALSDEVVEAWLAFFDDHADYRDGQCDFAVLRGILPPGLGGTRTGGGGGSSTFKRVLPLMAMLTREGQD